MPPAPSAPRILRKERGGGDLPCKAGTLVYAHSEAGKDGHAKVPPGPLKPLETLQPQNQEARPPSRAATSPALTPTCWACGPAISSCPQVPGAGWGAFPLLRGSPQRLAQAQASLASLTL